MSSLTARSRTSPNPSTLRGYVFAGWLWFLASAVTAALFVRETRHLPPFVWIYNGGAHGVSPWVAYYGTGFLLRVTLTGLAIFFVFVLAAFLLARFSGPFPSRARGRGILVLALVPMIVSAFGNAQLLPSVLPQADRAPLSQAYALSSLATSVTVLTIGLPILAGITLGLGVLVSRRMRPPRSHRPALSDAS